MTPFAPAQLRVLSAESRRCMQAAKNPVQPGNAASLPALAPNVITVGAPTPAASAAGGFPMTETRERELLRAVPTLRCTAELDGFRAQLRDQGETPTAALYQALLKQSERVAR